MPRLTLLAILLLASALLMPARGQGGAEELPADSLKAESLRAKMSRRTNSLKQKAKTERNKLKQKAATEKERLKQKAAAEKEKLKQKSDRLLERGMEAKELADSMLDVRNARVTTDTLWVARPQCTWTLRAKTDVIGDIIHLHTGSEAGKESDYYLTARPKTTVGMSANYRGISLALSLSPTKLLSDISDFVSSLNYYSNQFGGDLRLEKIDEFDGRTGLIGKSRRLDNTTLRSFAATGYYVFNGRHFSYPAVFNSTWEQRRSAGSLIVQGNLNWGRLKMGNPAEMDAAAYTDQLRRIDMRSFSIGIGYGYNYVLPPHWLLHATLQPSIMLWRDYHLHLSTPDGNAYAEKMQSNHLNIHLTARLGATYSWNRYFIGTTGVMHTLRTGRKQDISVTDTKWSVRTFFGVRF